MRNVYVITVVIHALETISKKFSKHIFQPVAKFEVIEKAVFWIIRYTYIISTKITMIPLKILSNSYVIR